MTGDSIDAVVTSILTFHQQNGEYLSVPFMSDIFKDYCARDVYALNRKTHGEYTRPLCLLRATDRIVPLHQQPADS